MKEIIVTFSKQSGKNAQHAQLMTDVLAAVPTEVAEAQGFAAQRTAFEAAVNDELVCFQADKGYLETADVAEADNYRDGFFMYYKRVAEAAAESHPDPEFRKNGSTAFYLFKEAGDATRKDYASETAILSDLVAKMRVEPYVAALAALGLADAADEIEAANEAFNNVYTERSAKERSRAYSMTMKQLRPITDDAYDELAKAINALYAVNEMVTKDAEKRVALEQVIDDVNAVVLRYRKTVNQGSGTSTKPEPETPGDTETPVDTDVPTDPDEGNDGNEGGSPSEI